ncbi:MAG: MBL fold metallo-hydrolase [Clostridia bacterium]|nr:MBL fold metallo-hydrolase [Clostridia bacterium]
MYERLYEINAGKPWLGRMKPFRVVGNVYFIGTYQASSHIVDTGEGLIMIDTGYANTAYLVLHSLHELGFDVRDIRYIVNTHWHGDHTEATAAFVDLSGAKALIGREDAEKAAQHFTPDIWIDDGDTLSLGNVTMRFMHTPGHTKGTISFFFDVEEGGRTLRVGSFGGAGLNTMVRSRFDFEGCREAYRASLHRLMEERVDVFLGNHTWNNDTYGKSLLLCEGKENPFIDSTLWGTFLHDYEKRLDEVIKNDQ